MGLDNIKVLDCTIRDGGYLNNWFFDDTFVREMLLALNKSGVDIIEVGWRGTEKYFSKEKYGTWRFSTEEDLAKVFLSRCFPIITISIPKISSIHSLGNSISVKIRLKKLIVILFCSVSLVGSIPRRKSQHSKVFYQTQKKVLVCF